MFNDVIYLISIGGQTKTDGGETLQETNKRMVFAEVQSIRQSEFYQADANGLRPEIQFLLSDYLEYNNEKEIEHEEITYKVLRTHRKGFMLEIVCHGGVNNVGT